MEYKREIMPMSYLNYETDMISMGWIWNGGCVTADGYMYLWKRKIQQHGK